MRDSFVKALEELAHTNKDLVFITADLGFGVFDKFEEKYPNQYLNIGVSEQNMIGVGTGLALEGKTVFVYSIANFPTLRCLEQIRNDACYHEVNLNIVASGGGFTYGALGMSHHATEDISIMRSLPNINVVCPSTAWEAYNATKLLSKTEGVGYLRIEKGGINNPPTPKSKFNLGKSLKYQSGKDVCFISCGRMLEECLEAAKTLGEKNISCEVISMHTIKPIDKTKVKNILKKHKYIFTVEEHNLSGGLGSAVAEACIDLGLYSDATIKRIALNDIYSSIVGSQEYLRYRYGLDAKAISKKVLRTINNDKKNL